jgi:hypothetical protein
MASSPLHQLEVLLPLECCLLVFVLLTSQQYPPQYLHLMMLVLSAVTWTLLLSLGVGGCSCCDSDKTKMTWVSHPARASRFAPRTTTDRSCSKIGM